MDVACYLLWIVVVHWLAPGTSMRLIQFCFLSDFYSTVIGTEIGTVITTTCFMTCLS